MKKFIYHCSLTKIPNIEAISKLIEELDNEFYPPLRDRKEFISYSEYAYRLLKNGIVIWVQLSEDIIGLTSFYADSKNYKFAYWSYLGIKKEFRKEGIAKNLINHMLEICKSRNMSGLNGSCSPLNFRMQKLFIESGFFEIEDEIEVKNLRNFNKKDDRDKIFYRIEFKK